MDLADVTTFWNLIFNRIATQRRPLYFHTGARDACMRHARTQTWACVHSRPLLACTACCCTDDSRLRRLFQIIQAETGVKPSIFPGR